MNARHGLDRAPGVPAADARWELRRARDRRRAGWRELLQGLASSNNGFDQSMLTGSVVDLHAVDVTAPPPPHHDEAERRL